VGAGPLSVGSRASEAAPDRRRAFQPTPKSLCDAAKIRARVDGHRRQLKGRDRDAARRRAPQPRKLAVRHCVLSRAPKLPTENPHAAQPPGKRFRVINGRDPAKHRSPAFIPRSLDPSASCAVQRNRGQLHLETTIMAHTRLVRDDDQLRALARGTISTHLLLDKWVCYFAPLGRAAHLRHKSSIHSAVV
jgi:hypothetical protein